MATEEKKAKMSEDEEKKERIVWVDCEMSDLNIQAGGTLLEIACVVTDKNLNIVAEGPDIVIHQSDELLKNMDPWCIENHAKSGLTEKVRNSKVSLEEAESQVLKFVQLHTVPGASPLGGNSVHEDKRFLKHYMPKFVAHLHYRIIDVSTVKELTRRWKPEIYNDAPKKKCDHRALSDILESIKELQFYKARIFDGAK